MRTLADGRTLKAVARYFLKEIHMSPDNWDVIVGSYAPGFDAIIYAMAIESSTSWCLARPEAKDHGQKSRLEGARLDETTRVLLVSRNDQDEWLKEVIAQTGAPVVYGIYLSPGWKEYL